MRDADISGTALTIAAPCPIATADNPGQRLYSAFLAGRSANTLEAYRRDLAAFAVSLGSTSVDEGLTCLLEDGTRSGNLLLLQYRAGMLDAGLAPATVNRRLAAVRSAAKLARILGLSTWTPEIGGVKVESYRDTSGPGIAGTRSMLAAAAAQSDPVKAARDVAIIRLMFDLGLRRGEVVGLDVDDVQLAGRKLLIRGKGCSQKVPRTLPGATVTAIAGWLDVRCGIAGASEAALFVNFGQQARGIRITGRGLHHVIAGLGSAVGIQTRPHGLRHASITAALDLLDGDVRAVQQHARHASSETTMLYDDNRRDLAGQVAGRVSACLRLMSEGG